MPYSDVLNQAMQHGVSDTKRFGLCGPVPLCLLSLALCVGVLGERRDCIPCPPSCSCPGLGSSCSVNCSKAGLQRAPGLMELPYNATVLDLSYNGIVSLDENLLDNLTSLEKLYLQGNNISILYKEIFAGRRYLSEIDISNNQISTLEDGIFADLFNLSKINLSFNEFVCDCNLSWLPSWMNEEEANGVIIVDSEFVKCAKPSMLKDISVLSVNFSSLFYGSGFVACLPDRQPIVNLSLMSLQNSSRENCIELCFNEGELYAALDNESHCLCGSKLEPDSVTMCAQEAADGGLIQVCGCTVIEQAFKATIANFAEPRTFSLFEAARLTVQTLVNVSTFLWDFGDTSPPFNTTSHAVFHKYGQPGTYLVSVAFFVGRKLTSLHVEINITVPPGRLEMTCPPVVQTNKSIDVKIYNWGSNSVTASWSITTSNDDTVKESPFCPSGGHLRNDCCYMLVTNNSAWHAARQFCQSHTNGDLAIVKSPEIRKFIANITGCEHPVWIGLSDTASAGTLQWVDGSALEDFPDWLPWEPDMLPSGTCVLVNASGDGEWQTDLCDAKRGFVCVYRAGADRIPGADYLLVGLPAFSTHLPVRNITVNNNAPPSVGLGELMVFPGLWFSHKGYISVVEMATENLNRTVQVRFRIYRPRCAGADLYLVTPDSEEVCTSFAVCLAGTRGNETHGCVSGTKWCGSAKACLPLKRPCSADDLLQCPNLTPPRFSRTHPSYDIVSETTWTLLPHSATHYVVLLSNESIAVQANDIVAIQHNGEPGAFIQCQRNESSPWQQNYFSIVYSSGSADFRSNLTNIEWTEGVVCNLRLLYSYRRETVATSPFLRKGQSVPGNYTYRATVDDGSPRGNMSCSVQVIAPITDFSVIYPPKQNGVHYVPKNRPVFIVKVATLDRPSVNLSGSNETFSCEATCPEDLSPLCGKEDNNTCYSYIPLVVKDCNLTSITITVRNPLGSISKAVSVRAEDMIEGLTILPDPKIRVLSNTLVTYTARVSAGTDVMFKWTVDDKASFIHYNQIYKVIYQTEAVYKLSLTASNHVSSHSIICNVIVDKRNPLAELNVSGVPAVLVQGLPYAFVARVKVDAAINATFRWSFGDGSDDDVYQFSSPYNVSLSVPLVLVTQAVLQHNVTHVYHLPGEYNLSVSASDRHDNLSQLLPLRVYSRLSNVSINASSNVIAAGKEAEFDASLLPSSLGVTYIWSFGDNASQQNGTLRRVTHTFRSAGRYNVSVRASNAISSVAAHCVVEVLEEISEVYFTDNSPTELSAPTIVHAWVRTGTKVRWTFDMGDGTPLTHTSSSVMNYTYSAVGNYTVTVVASNPLGSSNASRLVEVFVLQVCRIHPAGCVQELVETNFTAYTPGDSANYQFFWDFGDGSPNETISGRPEISHNYTSSGDFPLYLVVSSSVNKVNYYSNMCVQPAISKVVVTPTNSFIQLGEEGTFSAEAFPEGPYTYLWDFGVGLDPKFRGKEANFTFGSSGLHWVNVTALNNVSSAGGAVWVEVQAPLTYLDIRLLGRFPDNLVLDQPYTFTAASDGDVVDYTWDFGDSGNGTGVEVTRPFLAAGSFHVRLEGQNMVSEMLVELAVIVKTPLRGLEVTANTDVAPVNVSILFQTTLQAGDSIHYFWTFCQACETLEGPPAMNHTFDIPGIFNVTVQAGNGVSTALASVQVHILEEIEGLAMVLGDLAQNCCLFANQTLWFQATSRSGTEISYSWTIYKAGENFFHTNATSSQAHFVEPGSYEIVLQASNLLGTLNISEIVAVLEPIGVIALRASPEPVAVNATTVITASLGTGTEVVYTWSLEPTIVVSTTHPDIQHSFQTPGVKRVNVTAANRLSSSRATLTIQVQEPVTGVNIVAQLYVASNATTSFQGLALRGTNISWQWTLPWTMEGGRTQAINKSFPLAGVYPVGLNASNDVSWEVTSTNVSVQDEIQGLQLLVSKWAVAPGQTVLFTVLLSSGTDVTFQLGINDTFTMLRNTTEYAYNFTLLGTYRVSLTGVNRVSCGHVDVEIQVLEPVAGLWLSGCDQQAIPAGVTKTFWAEVSGGFQVSYLWHFMLGEHLDVIAGQNVSYTPKVRGWLSVLLKASNNVSSENVSARVLVQNLILAARLTASPPIAVVNETVYLSLSVTPSFTHATFLWKFGDGSQHHANTSVLSHLYTRLGVYVVKVNASNYVSFYVAQATVTILVLKCETPQMSMILSDIMRRSQRNYLEADIDLRGCAEYQVEYQWEIYKSLSCTSLQEGNEVRPKNVDLKRPRLQLPHLSLTTGRYCVQFTISFEGTSYWKAVRSIVNVIPSPLVPIIDGGTFRSWSTMQDLVMDGSRSYDPDQPLQRQAPLDYKWMCTYPCLGPAGCGISGNGIIFSIPKKELRHNTNYTCRLNVSRPDREPQYVKQLISVKGGSSPLVSLMCVSCKAQAVYGVSKSSYVYLAGSCSNCEGTPQYVWKVENTKKEVLALNNDTTSTGSNGMNLVLRHGVLEDGDGYIFSLNVTDPLMEKMGFASIYIPPIHLPSGGRCQIYPTENISALTTSVTFICTGWETAGVPLVYTFILTRCGVGGKHCDEFYVYKGSQSEYCAVLPPGFGSNQFNAYLAVTVQNQLGASVVAVNQSVVINITSTPEGFHSLTAWMKMETETKLQELLKQGDPQPTVEYALALVTVLNEYERSKSYRRESANETIRRINIRSNITLALTSLKVTTVDDIQQISAALAQCTVISREFVCGECQKETLSALDNMITVLQKETGQGKMTPTSIGDNILVTVGGLIDITNKLVPVVNKVNQPFTGNPELVATKAYNLSMKLMQILMATRVLNEEPLSVSGAKMRAQGKRADPGHLLCLTNKSGCQFSIPPSFNSVFSNISDVTQVMFLVDSNPFPYGYIKNYTISSKVASIEFKMDNGSQIPIESLDSEKAITVTVSTNSAVRNVTVNTTVIAARKSVMVNITSGNLNKRAGLHIQVTYSVLNDSGTSNVKDAEPFIQVLLHNSTKPNEHNFKAKKRIYLESVGGSDHKLYTFFLSPDMEDTAKDYYLNITNYYRSCPVQASVGVYTSLCQYFNMTAMSWKTDGILPLEDTTPTMAVCLTQHLTAFGASLFVPPNSVVFINPVALNVFCAVSRLISFAYLGGSWFICSQRRLTRANLLTRANTPSVSIIRNYIVLITCGICFVIYVVSTVIVRKLDWIDIGRVGIIPLCGKDGFYKYEILVKTGWGRGSGTSSHVGINLCGREDKSGHRHLDNEDAFHRNSVDIFQIATDNSLGNIWKIHVWHDNKGLTPSWYLQHVIIKDLQTNNVYYFLVDDWLAVDKDGIEGLVEKEVLAASESKLRDFSRIFTAEIQRGFSEGHIWLSICDRPPRSCFTRVQRVTCCLVLVYLCFCASVVWYGVINDRSISDLPVSARVPLSGESVAAGVVSCIIIYPIYLIIILLFRKSRSRVTMTDSGLHESNVLEIDDYVHPSTAGSSFLTFADNLEEDYKDKLKTDVTAKSVPGWPDYDSMMNWPDLLSDQSFMGSNVPKLRRGRGTRHLGIETQLSSDDEPLSLGYEQAMAKAFSASAAEHLIQRMAFGGNNDLSTSHDSGRVSLDLESHLISNLTEIISGNEEVPTEAAIHHKASDFGQGIRPTQGIGRMANTRRIAFSDPPERCLFPFWCSYTAHALCFLLFSASITVCLWIGVCFTPRVALMWLISGIFSVLSSFFLLEPLKVLTEALYFSLVAKRIHPDEDDNLVEKPRVEQISERIGKVRPPQGYSLLQAREEARKVQILHKLLKNFIIYMLFLLVVLLINYGDSFRDAQSRLLHSSIRQGLVGVRRGVEFQKIKRSGDLFKWMSEVLLPYLYNNQSKTLIGCARLRQVRLEINQGQCLQQAPVTGQCVHYPLLQDTNHYEIGWKNPVTNRSNKWSYSTPDLPEVWYWGQTTAWDSGGYVQHLGRTMEQSNRTLWHLQESNWLDRKTRVVFVEFTQYCSNVDLYSVVTVLIEFPLLGGVFTTIDVKPFSLLRLSAGMDFPLVMMVFLMLFVIYFTISELLLICQEGKAYLFLFWNYLQWSVIILSICCVAVHLKRAKLGDRQWAHYLVHQDCFTNFYQLAYLSQVFTKLAAVLIFLLMVKVARQLRFVRRWSIFGKTLHNSGKELFAVVVASAGLLLAYAQLGYLFFSANLAHFKTFGGSVLSLLAVIQRGMNLGQCFFEYPSLCSLYYISYIVIEVWIVVRLCAAVLLQNYREIKLEMHRPAVEPQEYELAELFIRRLKMWIGVSKMKEFRHKVKFEGMVPLPTGSSRDSKSTCLHTASTISNISLSSSSSESTIADAFPPAGPNKAPQIEANIHRLLPLFETLLEQFDKVNSATEDVYQAECKLKQVQEAARQRRINSKAEELLAAYRRMRASRRLRDDRRPSPCTLGDRATAKDPQLGGSPLEDCAMPPPPRRKSKTSKMPDKIRQQTPGDHQRHSNPD